MLMEIAPSVLPFAKPAWKLIDRAAREGASLLFEGAQGVMLDVDHGTVPYVTSSSTVAGHAAAGSASGPSRLDYVLGVCKAYATRVGAGPFPSELNGETGRHLASVGRETGTVTGRKRRCGWFDAAMARQACAIAGVSGIALTKLDVLDSLPEIRICTGYRVAGARLDALPATPIERDSAEPVYETMPGWHEPLAGVRTGEGLPVAAKAYVGRIEELVGTRVVMISTSPERDDTVMLAPPFLD